MDKKRVLLLGPVPPPTGGDTVSTLNLLKSDYWERSGIILDHINTSGENRLRLPEENRSGIEIFRALRLGFQMLWKIPRSKAVLLLANSSFICTFGLAVLALSWVVRRPVIVKPFGSYLPEMIGRFGHTRKKATLKILSTARWILPQTARMADELARYEELGNEKLRQFPNFIPDSDLIPERITKPFSGKCIFIGHIKKEKGVFEIVEALRGNSSLSCDFYGMLVERDTGSFLEEIAANENLSYHGIIPPEDILATISGHDILLLPTYHAGEGMPGVILQAYAAGVPLITTEWKSIPEIVSDRHTGLLIPPRSPEAIAGAIALLAGDSALYQQIAANAFEYVKGFSEKAIVGDILVDLVLKLV
ncbi:MAG: glycosyltransferase family 4 protein [Candidatus Krumholzibacteriota bacterium]|nr:glycosyltransferase family 4 protein [Candidatus Krumholzibacteriota bacterium]